VWAMDFISDQLADGRRLRVLPIIDVHTRECLAIEVDTILDGRTRGSDSGQRDCIQGRGVWMVIGEMGR